MARLTSTSSTVKPFSAGREEYRLILRIRISPLHDEPYPLPLHGREARGDIETAEEHGQSHEGDAHGNQHIQQDVATFAAAASVSAPVSVSAAAWVSVAALQSSHDAMSLSLPSPPSVPSAPKDNRPKGSPLGPGTAYTYAWPQGSATIFLFT